jgi:hypothetical protein
MPVESDKAQRKFINKSSDNIKTSWPAREQQIRGDSVESKIKGGVPSEEDVICFYYINEDNVETSPQIRVTIGKEQCKALIDTGCQCSVMSEELYEELKLKGLDSLELPMQNVVLKSAFTGRTKKVRRQALMKLQIDITTDQIILIVPQLVTPFLLGMDFCTDNGVVINFQNNTLVINASNEGSEAILDLVNKEREADSKNTHPISRVIDLKTADHQTPLCQEGPLKNSTWPNQVTVEGKKLYNEIYELFSGFVEDTLNDRASRASESDEYECNDVIQKNVRGNYRHADVSVIWNLSVRDLSLHKGIGDIRQVTVQGESDRVKAGRYGIDGGVKGNSCYVSTKELKIDERLSREEKCRLLEVINRYKEHFVDRPERSKEFEYKFQMHGELPKSSNSRPIPFSLRHEVRKQIEEMIRDDIIEISHTPYVNPLTILQKENKSVRICVDARRVNRQMIPDRTKTPPANELLQRFHGAKYITSMCIDLKSAFLQVPLEKSSRIWTAFQFEGTTY